MIRFNLLPYRALAQRRACRLWSCALLAAAVAGGVIVFAIAHAVGLQRQTQLDDNGWLREAHRQLDADIARARMLQRETALLLARARYIESLAQRRLRMPAMLQSLAAQFPPGVFLERITQHAQHFTLDGYAASSSDVNTLLENLNRREQTAIGTSTGTGTGTGIDATATAEDPAPHATEPYARLLETRIGNPGQPLAFSLVLTPEDTL